MNKKPPPPLSEGYSAWEVIDMQFEDPKWAIPNILPEGLNILAGKPKSGKSFFALNIALAIANGGMALGNIKVEKGTVIYLALEDTLRRLQGRILTMIKHEGSAPKNLYLYTHFPRMDQGGLEYLKERVELYPDTRLLIIDTLAKIRPPVKGKNPYDEDYQTISELKRLSDACGISLLMIHHLRKTESENRFDDISGTFGITGAADGLLLLIRNMGEATAELHVTGRDVESTSYALKFHNDLLSWNLLGNTEEQKSTDKKQQIFDAIKASKEPISPKQMAKKTGLYAGYVTRMLPYLLKEGCIEKVGRGFYTYRDEII
ncbi:MAG: hypothetical protein B6I22_14655 [Desulfobacteraceae bacterium 4572_123]|nr:MAG: hypothetical protein B6I22_14655 [Desulfobacteraceae bacterium 4572_123]